MEDIVKNITFSRKHSRNILFRSMAWMLAAALVIVSCVPAAAAWDSSQAAGRTDIRFYEDASPGIRFYINAGEKYILETVTAPTVGSTYGEWSVFCLLRGMYTGLDYLNMIPDDYFEDYLERVENYVSQKQGILDRSKSTEWSRLMLPLTAMNYDITKVAGSYDFLEKLSESYSFSCKQGINGPVWEIIALNAGGYSLYTEVEGGNAADSNSIGKMIDYIIADEIVGQDGSRGGYALTGTVPDPDVTAMVLQALAPYYLEPEKYESVRAESSYETLAEVVERAVLVLSRIQQDNGGYASWGSINAESVAQVIVALTCLQIDPKAKEIFLPHIGESCGFIREGEERDGVVTNNMIDALLTFWDKDSGSTPGSGGFKHVTAGYDGGGSAGTSVNGMATDQAVYALIAYDRFLHGQTGLYDISDMTEQEYRKAKAASYTITFDGNGMETSFTKSYAPYAEAELPAGTSGSGKTFQSWNTKADGSGTAYYPGEILSMPEQSITLYAQYSDTPFQITWELQGGFLSENCVLPEEYTSSDAITLPEEGDISKPGCLFEGWYTNAEGSGNPVEELKKGSYGNKVFYAVWSVDWTLLNQFYHLLDGVTPGEITISDTAKILQARTIYDSLEEVQKECVTDSAYRKLVQAEKELYALQSGMSRVEIVVAMIQAIPETLTLQDEENIAAVRQTYDVLTDEEKEQVTNYPALRRAEAIMAKLQQEEEQVQHVISLIQNLGTVTRESGEQIRNAREQYEALSTAQKEMIEASTVQLLEEAESCYAALQESRERILAVRQLLDDLPDIAVLEGNLWEQAVQAKVAWLLLSEEEREEIEEESVAKVETLLQNINRLAQENMTQEDYEQAQLVIQKIAALQEPGSAQGSELTAQVRAGYEALSITQRALVENYYVLVLQEELIRQSEEEWNAVQQLISDISEIGMPTLDSKEYIRSLRNRFNALNAAQKKQVTNYSVLIEAENILSDLLYDKSCIDEVVKLVQSLGEISLDSRDSIEEARASYEALTSGQQEQFPEETLQQLYDAEQEIQRLSELVLQRITISASSLTLGAGEEASLSVQFFPENTISDKTIFWSSADSQVATVKAGTVRAVCPGKTMITARAGTLTAQCEVNVIIPLTGISLDYSALTMTPAQSQLLTVSLQPSDTTVRNIIWSSSDSTVAEVSDGLITARSTGSATITASLGGLTASCQVTVRNYRITYYLSGGKNHKKNPAEYTGQKAAALYTPSRRGYRFTGWYLDGARIKKIPAGMTGDLTLYARWKAVKAPSRPALRKVRQKTGTSLYVTIKQKTKADGIEIRCRKKKKKLRKSSPQIWKKKKGVISSLKKGKTWYICLRSYRLDSAGKKVYGRYSKVYQIKM